MEDPDLDKYGLGSLYTDKDYQDIAYTYGDYSLTLQALKTASTDYDLTG